MVAKQLFSLYREFPGGGKIEIMEGYVKKSDHRDLLAIAREWAMEGKAVRITTPVHYKDDKYSQAFGPLKGTKYEHKCPDLIVDGVFYEYESFVTPFRNGELIKCNMLLDCHVATLLAMTSDAIAGSNGIHVIARPYIFQINKGKMTGASSAITQKGEYHQKVP
jgi:hypothetical protein